MKELGGVPRKVKRKEPKITPKVEPKKFETAYEPRVPVKRDRVKPNTSLSGIPLTPQKKTGTIKGPRKTLGKPITKGSHEWKNPVQRGVGPTCRASARASCRMGKRQVNKRKFK